MNAHNWHSQNLYHKIRFGFWPKWKVLLIYFWWIIRYGGKKRIPKRVLMDSMKRTLEGLEQNLRMARDTMPVDMPEDERLALRHAIMTTDSMKSDVEEIFNSPESIQITFSKKEFYDLLLQVMLGSGILGLLADEKDKNFRLCEAVQDHLLQEANRVGWKDLVQTFEESLLPSDELCEEEEIISEDYNESVFWFELETRLGKRDFNKSVTEEEKKEMEVNGCYPERIQKIYEKYAKEFEKYGTDRLEIFELPKNEKE